MLPQDVNKFPLMCPLQRHADLVLENLFYKLTTPPENPLEYPAETSNILEAVPFPLLNQPSEKVLLRSALQPRLNETEWLIRYIGMSTRNGALAKKTVENPDIKPFTDYADYAQLLKSFRDEQSKDLISLQIPGVVRTFTHFLA